MREERGRKALGPPAVWFPKSDPDNVTVLVGFLPSDFFRIPADDGRAMGVASNMHHTHILRNQYAELRS